MRRIASFVALLCVSVGALGSASADDTHYENFRFGQRALGMGGAVSGFLSEASSGFYNPAGLAFLGDTTFAGSISFFGKDQRKLKNGLFVLNAPEDIEEEGEFLLGPEDLVTDGFLALPTSSALIKTFAGGKHVVGNSTYVVSDIQENFQGVLGGLDEGAQFNFSKTLTDRTIFLGPSYALSFGDKFALGLSVFYARRDFTYNSLFAFRFVREDEPDDFGDLIQATGSASGQDGALLGRLGVMLRPTPSLSFGLVVSSPSIHLHGGGAFNVQSIDTSPGEDGEESLGLLELTLNDKVRTDYPLHVGAGAAFLKDRFKLAISGNLYLPIEYNRYEDLDSDFLALFGFVNNIERELTINGAVGAEVLVTRNLPIRLGFFTNFASSPDVTGDKVIIDEDGDPTGIPELPKVDIFGGTFSVGYISGQDTINLGVEAQLGSGKDTIASLGDIRVVDREEFRVIVFLSGAMSFAKSKAMKIIKKDDKDAKADPAPAP